MSKAAKAGADANFIAGLILLCIACVDIGYGLCLLVHKLEGAAPMIGVGVAFAGVATIFIMRGRSSGKSADGAA